MDEQVKDPTTIDEQIHILSERGMQVDADLARQWLRSVSYYRLSGYWYPYREQRSSPVEWCNRFVSFGVGYALSWSGGSSCWVGWGVSRDLVRMSRLR